MPLKLWIATCIALLNFSLHAESASWERNGPAGFSAKATLSATLGSIPETFDIRLELEYPQTHKPNNEAILTHLLGHNSIYPPFRLISEEAANPHVRTYSLEPLIPGTFPLTFFNIPFTAIDKENADVEIISGILYYTALLPESAPDFLNYTAPLLPADTPVPLQVAGELRRKLEKTSYQRNQQITAIESHAIPWGLLLAGLIIGIITLFLKLSPKKHRQTIISPKRSLCAYRQAQQLLTQIIPENQTQIAETLFNYLTNTVRYHIEEKYNLPASTQTSEEFLQNALEADILEKEEITHLVSFLQTCDAVKFGKYNPTQAEIQNAFTTAHNLLAYDD